MDSKTIDEGMENKENDFLDFLVGAGVSGAVLMGIFIAITIGKFFI